MEYANRDIEYKEVIDHLESHSTPVIIHAYHASGVTSFVKNKLDKTCSSLYGSNVFYIDASSQKSLGDALLSCLVRSEQMNGLQLMVDKKMGGHGKSVLSAALEGISYVGPLLGRITEQRTAVPVYAGAYSSAIEEVLIQFFRDVTSSTRYLIIVDAVEMIFESSYDLLLRLLQCNSVQFILVNTQVGLQFNKLENYLFNNGIDTSINVVFDRPQIKLIKEIGKLYDIVLSTNEANKILQNTHQNIHSIIKQIRNIKTSSIQCPLSAIEKAIVSVLHIWSEPIEESILTGIIISMEIFAFNEHVATQNALLSLQKHQLIIFENQRWMLSSHHDPQVEGIISNIADQLLYKNIIYNYLSSENSGNYYCELRYILSKDLKCTSQKDARLYLRHLIIQGKEVPHSLLIDANLKKGNPDDCVLAGITYCRERKYQDAFEWIDSIHPNQISNDVEAFRATLLNRIRRSEDAEIALLKCLETNTSPSQQNLLRAFLISTYIHMERLSDAQNVFNHGKDLYPDSPLHGYLVRNATSAFKGYQKDLYEEALSDFKHDGDNFGYYSTLCNQGYALCKNGNPKEGLLLLTQAKDGLESFPQTNLHIIYNDLGLCYLLLDKYQDAYNYLFLAKSLAVNSTPMIFSTINLACTEAVMNQTSNALKQLDSIEADVREHKLDRVRQHYYINRLLVEYLHDNKNIQSLIEKASSNLDRYNPDRTQYAIRVYKRFVSSKKLPQRHRWKELFSPCGLVYWYMDPLKLLPKGII